LGALVGLLTLALAAVLWREGGAASPARPAGGRCRSRPGPARLRVVLLRTTLAIFHGLLAQGLLRLAGDDRSADRAARARGFRLRRAGLKGLTVLAAALVYAQIVFGLC